MFVDNMIVDTTRSFPMRLFLKTTPVADFCDRCGSVCDAPCEVEADRERQTLALLTRGFRLS
jgi:hypothetical protein